MRNKIIRIAWLALAALSCLCFAGFERACAQNQVSGIGRVGGPLITELGLRPFAYVQNGQFAGFGLLVPDGPILLPDGTVDAAGAVYADVYALARKDDVIDARYDQSGRLLVRWQGEPSTVNRVGFALLDANRRVLQQKIIGRLPVQARFEPRRRANYLWVAVENLDGTTNTTLFALHPPTVRRSRPKAP